jgi:DNA polymerase
MDATEKLAQVRAQLESDAPKLPLAGTAKNIVPGEGNAEATVLFIGEAPGAQEAIERRPFVGRSGQLLRKTLAEIKLPSESYYISNIIKARPPENRDPNPEEITAYKPYLDAEILAIDPVLIVTLGRFSMAKFLPDVRISQVHGRLHRVVWQNQHRYVLPMYHPAAALRSTQVKDLFIQDCAKIPKAVSWIQSQEDDTKLKQQVADALLE